ncbi:unnamed protein product [Dicrocoelium dendriticum]|nr:unnamed protein product [Dicrocoelium dendriticum]
MNGLFQIEETNQPVASSLIGLFFLSVAIMKTVHLNDGFTIPTIGFGTWQLQSTTIESCIMAAVDAGYQHFDCALVYQNEALIGSALSMCFSSGQTKRSDFSGTPTIARNLCLMAVARACLIYNQPGDSLFPMDSSGHGLYDSIPPEETWKAMEQLVTKGLIARILQVASIKPVMLQVESHLGFLNEAVISYAKSVGLAVTAYSPLGCPGSKNKDFGDLLSLPAVRQLAEKHGKTSAQILLRHAIQRGLCVIPKSSNTQRIRENIALFDFELSSEDMKLLNSAGQSTRRIQPQLMFDHPEFPFRSKT